MFILRSGPVAAVQGAVLDGLGEVRDGEMVGSVEVRDGAGYLEDPVVGAGGESLLLHGSLEEAFGVGAELAMSTDLAGGHLSVGEDAVAGFLETVALTIASREDAGADFGRALGGCPATQLLILNGRHLYMYIYAIEKRTGDFGDVALDHRWGAHALAGLVVEVATGAGIHRGSKHEPRGEAEGH